MKIFRKFLVIGLIILFVGTNVSSAIIGLGGVPRLIEEEQVFNDNIDIEKTVASDNITGVAFAIGKIDGYSYLDESHLFGPGYLFEYTNGWIRIRIWIKQHGFDFEKANKDDCDSDHCYLGVKTCNKPTYFGVLTQGFVCAIFPINFKPLFSVATIYHL